MSRSDFPDKYINPTQIIKDSNHLQTQNFNNYTTIQTTNKPNPKYSQSSEVQILLNKLAVLQEKLKQNNHKFNDCIRILRLQVASKDKINQSLKDEICTLRQDLNQLKSLFGQFHKFEYKLSHRSNQKKTELKTLKPSKLDTPLLNANAQSVGKQNLSTYMIETLCSSKKLSQALAKTQSSNNNKTSKLQFKLQGLIKQSKVANLDEYYHHHLLTGIQNKKSHQEIDTKTIRLKSSPCTRKAKSKSIGGILKTKIFLN